MGWQKIVGRLAPTRMSSTQPREQGHLMEPLRCRFDRKGYCRLLFGASPPKFAFLDRAQMAEPQAAHAKAAVGRSHSQV